MIITSSLAVNLTTTETLALGLATANVPDPLLVALAFSNGTGSGQVDRHWELPSVTLAAGASVTYTLSALSDLLGRTVALAKVRAFCVAVKARTAGDSLTLGDPTGSLPHAWNAPFGGVATGQLVVTDLVALAAAQTDGYAVAAGTSDQLLVKNTGANPITFAIAVAGTSV